MTFTRVPAGKKRCSATHEHLGPLFADGRSKCRAPGEWIYADQPEAIYGRFCWAHMLDRLAASWRQDMRTNGYPKHPPILCGGNVVCRDFRLCQVECDGDPRRSCRAMAQPHFAHVFVARRVEHRFNWSFNWSRRWSSRERSA